MGLEQIHQEEIQAYKMRIQQLEDRNESIRETNTELLKKLQNYAELTKLAKVANNDLHVAFEYVREENLQIAARQDDQNISQEPEEKEDIFEQKYINLVSQSVSWLNNKAELQQRIKFLDREIERYERDNKTLSKQVRHLIKTLEEERGMIIKSAREAESAPTCAADVIDSRLVTFESIADLQQNNQKLLSLVKEMSKREEEQEIQLESEEVAKLNEEIKGLRSEIQTIQNDREQLRNTLNKILKERDLFKILLTKTRQVEHMTPDIFQKMVSIACLSGPAASSSDDDTHLYHEKDAHIADLKSALAKVEQNLVELRDSFDRSKIAHNEELKLKDELLEKAHLKVVAECQRADVFLERNKMLEENMSSLSAEYDEARAQVQKLSFEADLKSALAKVEQNLVELRDSFDQSKQAHNEELKLKDELLEKAELRVITECQRADAVLERNKTLEENMSSLSAKFDEAHTHRLSFEADLKSAFSKFEQNLALSQSLQGRAKGIGGGSKHHRDEIIELQRLRNLERSARLKMEREYFRLISIKAFRPQPEPKEVIEQATVQAVEQLETKEPEKVFKLKRRKFD